MVLKLCGLAILMAIVVSMLSMFPTINEVSQESLFLRPFADMRAPSDLAVMTFNVRLDGIENNPNNHFTKRVGRIQNLFERIHPDIVGLQEPFAGQVLHIMSKLHSDYSAIGYDRGIPDMGDRRVHNDYQVGMIYNTSRLHILETDYIWLSKTPRKEGTKDWNSMAVRTLNIARFNDLITNQEIIVFNTHIDVKSELARRKQAAVVAETIAEWQEKYPAAVCLLLGDFNSAPGHQSHVILTEGNMVDVWDVCNEMEECLMNDCSCTFHGWLGTLVNSFFGRFVSVVGFTANAMGFNIPHFIPHSPQGVARAALNLFSRLPEYPIWESLPRFPFNRLHVDWILISQPTQNTSYQLSPKFIAVVELRSVDFSSDHFPVLTLLDSSL